jgi:hypothetical protein
MPAIQAKGLWLLPLRDRLSLDTPAFRWSHILPAFEHTPSAPSKTAFLTGGGAKSGVFDALIKFQDPDLSQIIAAWPILSKHVKSAILKMVKDARK